MKNKNANDYVLCFRWHFKNEKDPRYFYCDSLEECKKRIEKTYKCSPADYTIVSVEYRDSKTNRLIKEEVFFEQLTLL